MINARRTVIYKKKMRKIAIVTRRGSPNAVIQGRELAKWLRLRKMQVLSPLGAKLLPGVKPLRSPTGLDLVVVLGGDGTYLEAVRMLDGERVPLLGVNMGSLGFLTVTRLQDLFAMMELALAG
jgi:NAD+ kinase